MIYGIGTDILSLARIDKLYANYGEKLAERLLHRDEWQDFSGSHHKSLFLAKRFAAKEAFSKAVGTGIREVVGFQNIGIHHNPLGKPEFYYSQPLTDWIISQGITNVHLSLSDEKEHILAFVVAEM